MAALSRVSQLKLSLILSRMRREMMMRGCSASTASTASTSQHDATESLTQLIALKSHISQMDKSRRSAASMRLFGHADDAIAFAASEQELNRDATQADNQRQNETLTSERNHFEHDVTEKCDSPPPHSPTDRATRGNSPDFMGALESVFHDAHLDSRIITKKSWTTDDIMTRPSNAMVKNEKLSLGTIFSDDSEHCYHLLDKYVAHNIQQQTDLNALFDGEKEAEKEGFSSINISEESLRSMGNCPYYLSSTEGMDSADGVDYYAASTEPDKQESNRPSKEQLIEVFNSLRSELPRLLDKNLDYSMFANDVVFVNNWHGHATTSVGVKSLICRMGLLRAICNVLFVRAEMQLLKIMAFEEDSCVRTRWRIEGQTLLSTGNRQWFDGTALFRVGKDGKITRIEVERVMPHEEPVKKKPNPVGYALAALIGSGGLLGPAMDSVPVPVPVLATREEGRDDGR